MSRDYKNIKQTKQEESPANNSDILPFITGLTIGLIAAVSVFIYMDGRIPAAKVITKYIEVEKQGGAENPIASKADNAHMPAPTFEFSDQEPEPEPGPGPEPEKVEFEFYKILPNKEVDISELVAAEQIMETTLPIAQETSNDTYIIQVASFKNRNSAESEKAKLALLGMQAKVQAALIRDGDIRYRVRLGPYTSIKELRATRKILYDNHYEYIEEKLPQE